MMSHRDGLPYCANGDMPLSIRLAELLAETIGEQPVLVPAAAIVSAEVGSLHCARCSGAMRPGDQGRIWDCPRCGLAYGRSITFQIIELHAHADCYTSRSSAKG